MARHIERLADMVRGDQPGREPRPGSTVFVGIKAARLSFQGIYDLHEPPESVRAMVSEVDHRQPSMVPGASGAADALLRLLGPAEGEDQAMSGTALKNATCWTNLTLRIAIFQLSSAGLLDRQQLDSAHPLGWEASLSNEGRLLLVPPGVAQSALS
ncbi:MAG: hypothetical protein ACR2GX_03055 [Candidatus Dormibacteria bacterium]